MDNVARFLNYKVGDIVGKNTAGNVFGVELELEGRGVRMDGVSTKGWRREDDGSLRGESIEYVFAKPSDIEESKALVSALFAKFKANNVDIKNSYRTSTHVHINFSDKSVKQLLNFFVLFTMLEDILERYSGEDRAGNLFCISSRRAEHILQVVSDSVLKKQDFRDFAADRYKYAACNLSTLYKFGTCEIRTMRGATSEDMVNNWLDILNDVYVRALKAKSPIEFIENISLLGPDGFFDDVFQLANKKELLKGLPVGFDFRGSLLQGARLCQLFVYEIADEFEKEDVIPQAEGVLIHPGTLFYAKREDIVIYRGDRGRGLAGDYFKWFCIPEHGMKRFRNGDGLEDERDIFFDADVGRFKSRRHGRYYWFANHPFFGNEQAKVDAFGPWCHIAPPMPELPDFQDDEDDF